MDPTSIQIPTQLWQTKKKAQERVRRVWKMKGQQTPHKPKRLATNMGKRVNLFVCYWPAKKACYVHRIEGSMSAKNLKPAYTGLERWTSGLGRRGRIRMYEDNCPKLRARANMGYK